MLLNGFASTQIEKEAWKCVLLIKAVPDILYLKKGKFRSILLYTFEVLYLFISFIYRYFEKKSFKYNTI